MEFYTDSSWSHRKSSCSHNNNNNNDNNNNNHESNNSNRETLSRDESVVWAAALATACDDNESVIVRQALLNLSCGALLWCYNYNKIKKTITQLWQPPSQSRVEWRILTNVRLLSLSHSLPKCLETTCGYPVSSAVKTSEYTTIGSSLSLTLWSMDYLTLDDTAAIHANIILF